MELSNTKADRLIRGGGLREFINGVWIKKTDPNELMDNGHLPRKFRIGKKLFAQVVQNGDN